MTTPRRLPAWIWTRVLASSALLCGICVQRQRLAAIHEGLPEDTELTIEADGKELTIHG